MSDQPINRGDTIELKGQQATATTDERYGLVWITREGGAQTWPAAECTIVKRADD